jgi:2-phosphosulfolactate phosphatase
MKTIVRSCLSGAKESRGVVVLIDVFRASNTILMLLRQGVRSIFAVASIKEAFRLKKEHPQYLLAGEREGIKINGFDIGNSPHEVAEHNVQGKHIIFTTSAGTQGIAHAERAERILVGSFGNSAALTEELVRSDCQHVDLLAIGTNGLRKAIEDEQCALYLKEILDGTTTKNMPDFKAILKGEGALRLKRLGQENDYAYCLGIDIYDIVPEVCMSKGLFEIRALKRPSRRDVKHPFSGRVI